MNHWPIWVSLILAWAACSRIVLPLMLSALHRGRSWPGGAPSAKAWIFKSLLCPEWAWIGFWRAWKDSKPAPLDVYLHPRDLARTDFS